MSRFVVVATAVLLLMAVSVHSNPASSEESNPPKCKANESVSLCGRMCEPRCDDPKPNPMLCPAIECTTFTEACRCNEGYVRNKSDNCVRVNDC